MKGRPVWGGFFVALCQAVLLTFGLFVAQLPKSPIYVPNDVNSSMQIDPRVTLKVLRSDLKTFLVFVCSGLGLLLVVWDIFSTGITNPTDFRQVFGWLTAPLCGFVFIFVTGRLATRSRVLLVLSKQGLLDLRLFGTELPWAAVTKAAVKRYPGGSFIQLQIEPEVLASLKMTTAGRIIYWANKPFAANSIYLHSGDLDATFPELKALVFAYLKAHNPTAL